MGLGRSRNGRGVATGRLGQCGGVVGLVLALVFGPGGPASLAATFEAQGRVWAVDIGRGVVTLDHGSIPGLLPPTRSEFPVTSGGLLSKVRPGDRVRITLAAPDESHGLLTVTSLAPEASSGAVGDRLLTIATAVLALLALIASVVTGLLVSRPFQALHRRVAALDHEIGMLRNDLGETLDGVRQIARALEEAATTLRVGYARELRRRFAPTAPAAGSVGPAASESNGVLVVVKRGRGELYHAVESGTVGPGCTAMWDRRRGERRSGGRHSTAQERRRGERRASPPETWTRLGFHLVPDGASRSVRVRPAGGERAAGR
jgi:hypothetical protein